MHSCCEIIYLAFVQFFFWEFKFFNSLFFSQITILDQLFWLLDAKEWMLLLEKLKKIYEWPINLSIEFSFISF